MLTLKALRSPRNPRAFVRALALWLSGGVEWRGKRAGQDGREVGPRRVKRGTNGVAISEGLCLSLSHRLLLPFWCFDSLSLSAVFSTPGHQSPHQRLKPQRHPERVAVSLAADAAQSA